MIDTSYLDKVQAISEQDLKEISEAKYKLGLVNLVELPGESQCAIFAGSGVYESTEGQRIIKLAEAHTLLKRLGFKNYYEGAQLKEFT